MSQESIEQKVARLDDNAKCLIVKYLVGGLSSSGTNVDRLDLDSIPEKKVTVPAFLALSKNIETLNAAMQKYEKTGKFIREDIKSDLQKGENSPIIQKIKELAQKGTPLKSPANALDHFLKAQEIAKKESSSPSSNKLPLGSKSSTSLITIRNFFASCKPAKPRMGVAGGLLGLVGAGFISTATSPWLAMTVLGFSLNPVTAGILLTAGIILAAVGLALIIHGFTANCHCPQKQQTQDGKETSSQGKHGLSTSELLKDSSLDSLSL